MADAGRALDGLNLLLVDDDQDCREFVALTLEDAGAQVTQVGDAEAAIETLKSRRFDLVTTDKNLPNMDGIGLIRHIREKHGDVPIILITGFGSIGSAVDALKYGAQDYLQKPLDDTDLLIRAVRRSVDHHLLAVENRALQAKLQQALRMESVGVLAGGVAHDLNNILEPIVALPAAVSEQIDALCAAVSQAPPDGERLTQDIASAKEKLRIMEESGRQAAGIVKDLLTMSESGTYEKKVVDVNRILKDILASGDIAETVRRRPDLRVETALHPSPAWISGSEWHLGRVLVNLLRNAIHAMEVRKNRDASAEMRLTLRTSLAQVAQPIIGYEVIRPGSYAVLEVADTGTGIEQAVMEKMFEPFFTTRPRGAQHGIGMGLSIVHRVVKDHGGFVDVQTTVNQGTTFRLYLAAASAPAVASRPKTAIQGQAHVLVVDDEPGARHVAKFLLQKLGFKPTLAANGHEALKFFEDAKAQGVEKPCDVMVLDMVMEDGFDGLTTFEHVVKLYPAQKVIVASGYAPEGRAQVILDRGAGYLGKPYGLQELSDAVRQQLEKN